MILFSSCFDSTKIQGTKLQVVCCSYVFFFFSSRRRHTRLQGDWSSDVCSSDLWLLTGVEEIHVLPPRRGRWPHSQYAVLAVQENLAVLRQVVPDQRRHADTEIHVGTLGNIPGDALRDLLACEFRVAHAAFSASSRRGLRGTFTTRVTKIPGVTMHSGSSAPSSTISYTCAMVHFAALAMVGPKLRALLR